MLNLNSRTISILESLKQAVDNNNEEEVKKQRTELRKKMMNFRVAIDEEYNRKIANKAVETKCKNINQWIQKNIGSEYEKDNFSIDDNV